MKLFKPVKPNPISEEELYWLGLENEMWVKCYDENNNLLPINEMSQEQIRLLVEVEWHND